MFPLTCLELNLTSVEKLSNAFAKRLGLSSFTLFYLNDPFSGTGTLSMILIILPMLYQTVPRSQVFCAFVV